MHGKDYEKRIAYLNRIDEKINSRNVLEVDFNILEIDKIYKELNPETILIEQEEYEFLRYIIEYKLRPKERDILKMRFLDSKKYSYKEIAKILKININLVFVIEKEALKNLKFFLTHEDLFYNKKSSK